MQRSPTGNVLLGLPRFRIDQVHLALVNREPHRAADARHARRFASGTNLRITTSANTIVAIPIGSTTSMSALKSSKSACVWVRLLVTRSGWMPSSRSRPKRRIAPFPFLRHRQRDAAADPKRRPPAVLSRWHGTKFIDGDPIKLATNCVRLIDASIFRRPATTPILYSWMLGLACMLGRKNAAANPCQQMFPLFQKSIWWAMTGSNRRPPRCKRGALPAELIAPRPRLAPCAVSLRRPSDPCPP